MGPHLRPLGSLAHLALVGLFVVATMIAQSGRAYAYCSTEASSLETHGAGGQRDYQVWEAWPQAVSGYIQGRLPDPVTTGSTAWVALANRSYNPPRPLAQTGWLRKPAYGLPSYYVFAAYINLNHGHYHEGLRNPLVVPDLTKTYEVHHFGGDNSFGFFYQGSQWGLSEANMGWQPNTIQIASESKNRADHFPGSNTNKIEFFFLSQKVNESWSSLNLSPGTTPASSTIAGLQWVSGNNFYTFDKRCWD